MKMRDFLTDFAEMSTYGATDRGGVHREAGTTDDMAVRAWLREVFASLTLTEHQDRIGNQFGLKEYVPGAPYVLVGSHLDSQPMAGKYDGAYGVLAAVHAAQRVIRQIDDGELTPTLNLGVVNWFNEEGSRFEPSMMGSSVYTGKLDLQTALATLDRAGVSVADVLSGEEVERHDTAPEAASYAEIHIEQGPVLEATGNTIGLVEATWGAKKYQVTITGDQGHTGATPMERRQDALYGAAKYIVAAREIVEEFPSGVLHTAVSTLELFPNSPVTYAGEVTINLDLRSENTAVLAEAETRLAQRRTEIEQLAGVKISQELTHEWGLMPYQSAGLDLAESVVHDLGHPFQYIKTVAGHDSTNMKDQVPTVMLFVPSRDGYSHNEKEFTTDNDMLVGVDMLTGVVRRLITGELVA
jgi:N-carbamoyl-L-amino-acid hydrolase